MTLTSRRTSRRSTAEHSVGTDSAATHSKATNRTAAQALCAVFFAYCMLLGLTTPAFAEVHSPMQQMQSVMDEVIEVVEALPEEEQRRERLDRLREIITPNFDFEEMAKRSLGQPWLSASEKERKEYVSLFSDLLAHTYLKRIDNVRRDMVTIDSERTASGRALVRTTVRYRGDTFPIDYRMLERENGWQVYDVVIENIGLVSNYRNEFAGIVRRERMAGLLKRLNQKIEEEGIRQ